MIDDHIVPLRVDGKRQVLDKGFVQLLEHMGTDATPPTDARISTGSEKNSDADNRILTRYLLRHKHTTPYEGTIAKFLVKAPILVIREWFRHRTFSYNEESGRYKQLEPEYYVPSPERVAKQSLTNKQGSGETFDDGYRRDIVDAWEEEQNNFEASYVSLLSDGMAKEIARLNMPVSHYSTFIVTGNLLNWMRFLQLRMAKAAQWEIRQYANAIAEDLRELFPVAMEAFQDYWLDSITLSRQEIQLLREMTSVSGMAAFPKPGMTQRETDEFSVKMKAIYG